MDSAHAHTRTTSLTQAQRHYLRLVGAGMTSKQIAQQVGGSHHTINAEIGIAMRILGATSRHQAAILLDAPTRAGSYEPSYDAPAVVAPAVGRDERPQDEVSGGEQPWPIPVATAARPINRLSTAQRLAWVLVIATVVALSLGGLVSGITTMLTSLSRLG